MVALGIVLALRQDLFYRPRFDKIKAFGEMLDRGIDGSPLSSKVWDLSPDQ